MKPKVYPFAAIVGQSEMKLALLLAAVDWRLSVLLGGDKGSGKTTSARALAVLLPASAPYVNLPIGTTEDRLLGGLHLESALQGKPVLKPGLLSQAHGGVLYVDEVNLLPSHLGDALLDAAAMGVNIVEREGFSASHPAEFALLGSMNPEEGSLRPQLLDRFALSVRISASLDSLERQSVLERRMAFDRDPEGFSRDWDEEQEKIKAQIAAARASIESVFCSRDILQQISSKICERGVRSLRADLAATRAAIACAALCGKQEVELQHVSTVLPLVLAHRCAQQDPGRSSPPGPESSAPSPPEQSTAPDQPIRQEPMEYIFPPAKIKAPALQTQFSGPPSPGTSAGANGEARGPVVRSRKSESPSELDLRSSLHHAVSETGSVQLRRSDLHQRVRTQKAGTRYLFVVDSSGSQAARQRMRLVKGAATDLLSRSFQREDEVGIIIFRGAQAHLLLEPTRSLNDAIAAFEYFPTGGRTPLAHALDMAQSYITPSTLLLLFTDGGCNVQLRGNDAWEDALEAAGRIRCAALVIETSVTSEAKRRMHQLAEVLRARCLSLTELTATERLNR